MHTDQTKYQMYYHKYTNNDVNIIDSNHYAFSCGEIETIIRMFSACKILEKF